MNNIKCLNNNKFKFISVILVSIAISLTLIDNINAKSASKTNPDSYQIELIIFKYSNLSDMHIEQWPLYEINVPENAAQLINPDSIDVDNIKSDDLKTKDYVSLNNSKLKYKNVFNNIKNNSRYKVISHIGWQESRKDLIKAKPVYITAGRTFQLLNDLNKKTELVDTQADDLSNNKNLDSNFNLATPEISGVVKIALKKYFHADINLLLSLPAKTNMAKHEGSNPFELISTDRDVIDIKDDYYMQTFLIEDKTRLKSKQLGYIDHPVFGAVIVITAV